MVILEKEDVTRSAIPRADAATAAAAAVVGSGAVWPVGGVPLLPGVPALEPLPDAGGGLATPRGGSQGPGLAVGGAAAAGREACGAPLPAGLAALPEPLTGEALGCVAAEALNCWSAAAVAGAGFVTEGAASTPSASLLSAPLESAPSGP